MSEVVCQGEVKELGYWAGKDASEKREDVTTLRRESGLQGARVQWLERGRGRDEKR